MKKEYDFSKGERGKFYRPETQIEESQKQIAASRKEFAESRKEFEERINALINIVDDLIRKRPPR